MGAINYGSNNILCSLGYVDIQNYPKEEDIKAYREEFGYDEEDYTDEQIEEYIMDDNNLMCEDNYKAVKEVLSGYEYYDVSVECGYYEGFYISIDDKYTYLDTFKDKIKMQKELTQLKKDLIECINTYGVRVCYPGWCTGWEKEIKESIKVLNECIKIERKRIKSLYTEKTFWNLTKEERHEKFGWCI